MSIDLKKIIKKEIETFLKENVVDFTQFKKQREENTIDEEYIVAANGMFVFDPEDVIYVKVTNKDQKESLADGNVEKAVELGALTFSVTLGEKQ